MNDRPSIIQYKKFGAVHIKICENQVTNDDQLSGRSLSDSHDKCAVRTCSNTLKDEPCKIFFPFPSHQSLRASWFRACGLDINNPPKFALHCCEVHFDLKREVKTDANVAALRNAAGIGGVISDLLKDRVVPHRQVADNPLWTQSLPHSPSIPSSEMSGPHSWHQPASSPGVRPPVIQRTGGSDTTGPSTSSGPKIRVKSVEELKNIPVAPVSSPSSLQKPPAKRGRPPNSSKVKTARDSSAMSKECIVSGCPSNLRTFPNAKFICVPFAEATRKLWFASIGRSIASDPALSKETVYFCTDHFKPSDLESFKLPKDENAVHVRVKHGVLPSLKLGVETNDDKPGPEIVPPRPSTAPTAKNTASAPKPVVKPVQLSAPVPVVKPQKNEERPKSPEKAAPIKKPTNVVLPTCKKYEPKDMPQYPECKPPCPSGFHCSSVTRVEYSAFYSHFHSLDTRAEQNEFIFSHTEVNSDNPFPDMPGFKFFVDVKSPPNPSPLARVCALAFATSLSLQVEVILGLVIQNKDRVRNGSNPPIIPTLRLEVVKTEDGTDDVMVYTPVPEAIEVSSDSEEDRRRTAVKEEPSSETETPVKEEAEVKIEPESPAKSCPPATERPPTAEFPNIRGPSNPVDASSLRQDKEKNHEKKQPTSLGTSSSGKRPSSALDTDTSLPTDSGSDEYESMHLCSRCLAQFKSRLAFEEHERLQNCKKHSGTYFNCETCGRTYYKFDDLKTHTNIIHRYVCPKCSDSFRHRRYLENHVVECKGTNELSEKMRILIKNTESKTDTPPHKKHKTDDRSGKIAITNCNVRLQRMRLPPTEPGRCCFDLKALEAWWTSNETYQHPGATSSDPVVPKKADQKHLPLLPTPSSRKTDARASPSLRGPSPSLRGPSPSLRGPSPSLRGASPSLRGPSPSLRGPSPKTTGTHTSSTPPGPTPRKTDSKQPVSRPGPLSSKRTSDGSYRPGPLCSKTGRDASSSRPSKKSDEVDASENASSSKMTPKLTIKVSSPVTFVSSTKSEIGSPQDDDDARDDVSSPQPADANKSDSGVDEIDIESISSKESKTKKRPLESSSDDEVIKPSRTRTRRGNGDEDEDSPRSPERRRRSTRDLRERKIPNMAEPDLSDTERIPELDAEEDDADPDPLYDPTVEKKTRRGRKAKKYYESSEDESSGDERAAKKKIEEPKEPKKKKKPEFSGQFICGICSAPFAGVEGLRTHHRNSERCSKVAPGTIFKCEVCDKVYLSQTYLDEHRARTPACQIAKKDGKNEIKREGTLSSGRPVGSSDDGTQKKETTRPYQSGAQHVCKGCSVLFNSALGLGLHLKRSPKCSAENPNVDVPGSYTKSKVGECSKDEPKRDPKLDTVYVCTKCCASFSSVWGLRTHERSSSSCKPDRPYEIPVPVTKEKADKMKKEYLAKRGDAKPEENVKNDSEKNSDGNYQCGTCNATFTSIYGLRTHQRMSETCKKSTVISKAASDSIQKGENVCPNCSAKFSTAWGLRTHLRNSEICKEDTSVKVSDSGRVKNGSGCFLCPQCPKTFQLPTSLEQHFVEHASGESCDCPKCKQVCTDNFELQGHFRSKHPGVWFCILCNDRDPQVINSFKEFYAHIFENHAKDEENAKKYFKCQTCYRSFTSKYSLDLHVSHCRKMAEQTFSCASCWKVFSKKIHIMNHIKYAHDDKDIDKRYCFKCPTCPRRFLSERDWKEKHKKEGCNQEELKCEECGEIYIGKERLKVHMRLCHPEAQKPKPKVEEVITKKERPSSSMDLVLDSPMSPEPEPEPSQEFEMLEIKQERED